MTRPQSLPHTGIATFCKAPYVEDLEELEADVAVLGVPLDAAAGMRPGCRQGPRAIRDASTRFGFLGRPTGTGGFFDINRDRTLMEGVRFADVGDADVVYYDMERNVGAIEELVARVIERGALPVVLGGDHSISYPAIRAFRHVDPLNVVLFDAHLDYKRDVMGLELTNNSPFRRAHELPFVDRICTFGVRGIKSTGRDLAEAREHGHVVVSNYEVREDGAEAALERVPEELGDFYVSVDIDALDPSLAPGTESPEAEGLSFTHVKRILQGLSRRGRMVGLDLVEVNPYLDPAELTPHVSVQLLIEALAARFDEEAA